MVNLKKLSARQKILIGAMVATVMATWWASSVEDESADLLALSLRQPAPAGPAGTAAPSGGGVASAPQSGAGSARSRPS